MLWVGILPAFAVFYVRRFVKEPKVWVENRRLQRAENREVRAPLFAIFKRGVRGNTLTACWWMASGFVTYYSINALFATHLQKDLGLSPALVATPIALGNLVVFVASGSWGWVADRIGRRWAMIIPALLAIPVAPLYLFTHNILWIAIGFMVQGACGGGGMQGQMPTYLSERFPTEVRATASGFCFHQGAIWGGLVPLVLTFFAVHYDLGFAIPMVIGTCLGALSFACALLVSPETKGIVMVPDLAIA
jgi:SHS family lactate transporter-like MFS transporter